MNHGGVFLICPALNTGFRTWRCVSSRRSIGPSSVAGTHTIEGIQVYHPRAYYIPKIFRNLNPTLFAASICPLVKRIRRDFAFDQMHVDWLFPDACAVAKLANKFGVPFTVSVAGTDANVYMNYRIRRLQILHALTCASAIVTRSLALQRVLEERGVGSGKIQTVYNGVDCGQYRPIPRDSGRQQLGINSEGPVLLYVGNMVPVKGVEDLLSAFCNLRSEHGIRATLVMVGDGYLRPKLEKEARQFKLEEDAIRWTGNVPPSMVPLYMSAADLLCLASHSEGVPNVLLEANACGVPFVATNVGGIPEITTANTGTLTPPQNPAAFARAIKTALETRWDSQQIRRHALTFSWENNAKHMVAIFEKTQADYAIQPQLTSLTT
jgi:glycosyltransferase involved in cell wall biosynthesis